VETLASVVFDQLTVVAAECRAPGWDGYAAAPVTQETVSQANRFLEALPPGTPPPSVGAEPDGHLTFEWHRAPRRTPSVSVGPDGELHYAALVESSKAYGTEPFITEVPAPILQLIHRVESS